MLRSTAKTGRFSGGRRAALDGGRRRESPTLVERQRFRVQLRRQHRRQRRQRRQGRAEVVRSQAQFASGMGRQAMLLVRRMPDGMRPRRQLGEEENGDEQQMAQRIHEGSLVDLDE